MPPKSDDRKQSPVLNSANLAQLKGVLEVESNNKNHADNALSDASSYYEDSIAGDYETEDTTQAATSSSQIDDGDDDDDDPYRQMTPQDLEICRILDQEYELALEERDVAYSARSQSVRQSACFAVSFMGIFLAVSVTFFLRQTASWDVADALLFSIYTITTVGYGNLHHPETPAFQLYTIFFILIGIATLTIMVAQVYQWLSLEASRAQHSRDRLPGGFITSANLHTGATADDATAGASMMAHHHRYTSPRRVRARAVGVQIGDFLHVPTHIMDRLFAYAERLEVFLKENEIGRGISVLFPFCSLIVVGAAVVGSIEGWTAVESLYFR